MAASEKKAVAKGGNKKPFNWKERYSYHCRQSKAGAVNGSGKTVSDFGRGRHAQIAESMGLRAAKYRREQGLPIDDKYAKILDRKK